MSGRALVAWFGPVNLTQVPGATVPGATAKSFGCTGDGIIPPRCSSLAYSLGYPKSILPAVASRMNAGLDSEFFLGAFSAGGHVVRRILENPEDRQRVRAVMLSDAMYSDRWADTRHTTPIVQDTWIDFAAELSAPGSKQLFVATASPSPNFEYASGVQMLRELRHQVELRTGRTFEKLSDFWGVNPGPDKAYRLGNVILAEYPMDPLGHAHFKIAPQVWQQVLLPWLSAGPSPEPPKPTPEPSPAPAPVPSPEPDVSPWWAILAFTGATLLSYELTRLFRRMRRR